MAKCKLCKSDIDQTTESCFVTMNGNSYCNDCAHRDKYTGQVIINGNALYRANMRHMAEIHHG